MNKKDLILKSFSEMDINMLELLLNDSYTYQDADKYKFLEKLEELFNEFKSFNDSKLLIEKGKCAGKDCENCGCSGYALIGNHSKNHADFIFEESIADYTDLYHCDGFKIENEKIELNDLVIIKLNTVRGYIESQKNSIDHIIKEQNCGYAIEELSKKEGQTLTANEYMKWLRKHKDLYNSIPLYPLYFEILQKFYQLYSDIMRTINSLQYNQQAFNAQYELDRLDKTDEETIIDWLLKYEEVNDNICLKNTDFYEEEFSGKVKENTRYSILIADDPILYIEGEMFQNVIKFEERYADVHWPIFDRMSKEMKHMDKEPEFEYSLRYFIKIRNSGM